MNVDVILLTYGEPPAQRFWDQWQYSNRILFKLTRLVAPIPRFIVPLIGAMRGRGRVKMWKEENYNSPLESITRQQADALQDTLNQSGGGKTFRVHITYEFRSPDLKETLKSIENTGSDALIFVPMYLPISDFTTMICERDYDQYIKTRKTTLPQPRLVTFRPKAQELADLKADYVRQYLDSKGITKDKRKEYCLLLGCHGTVLEPPESVKDSGFCDTKEMYDQLEKRIAGEFKAHNIGWLNHDVGGEWTSPSVEESIQEMIAQGHSKFVYYPFGFVADNAESQLEGRMAFADAGIDDYIHIPCLNENPEFIRFLSGLVHHHAEEALQHRATKSAA